MAFISYGRLNCLIAASVASLAAVTAASAQAINQPPPAGAILDLNGGVIPHGDPQLYTVDFTAAIANTAITFAFREDPAFIYFSNASVTDVTTPSSNLLTNGDFSGGTYTDNGNSATPVGWTYANVYGATYGGVVQGTTWYDGAVQAYDAISQTISTTVGDVYEISFYVTDNSGLTNWSSLSTNGDTTDTGGNGADVLAYAQAGLPPPGTVPEPSTWAMMLIGFAGLGFAGYRASRKTQQLASSRP